MGLYCIHFSKLENRKSAILKSLPSKLEIAWVTEEVVANNQFTFTDKDKVLGVSPRKIGMDLGVNSRSLSRARKRAKYEGYLLYLRSFIDKRGAWLVTSQIENRLPLEKAIRENLIQHMHAMEMAANSPKTFHLIIEDDALPSESTWFDLEKLVRKLKKAEMNSFVAFLGAGAGLKRTSSDTRIDEFGLYKTGTYGTRTAVATLYSRDVCIEIINLVEEYGLPDWMPIDFLLQVAMRKLKIKTYWQDPPFFDQGSENGTFKSSLR